MLPKHDSDYKFKGSVREKWKEKQVDVELNSIWFVSNFTEFCSVYQEKMVKNDLYRKAENPYKIVKSK